MINNLNTILLMEELPGGWIDLTIILLVLSVVLGIIIQLIRLTNRIEKITKGKNSLQALTEKINTLKQKVDEIDKRPTSPRPVLQDSLPVAPERPIEIPEPEDNLRVIELSVINNIQRVPEPEIPEDPPQENQMLFFAKVADLDNGFSQDALNTFQNGEQTFEVVASGETAIYRISPDLNAQKYALSDYKYALGKACDFLNQPFRGCEILLKKEGTLIRINGDWIIKEKALIEFK